MRGDRKGIKGALWAFERLCWLLSGHFELFAVSEGQR